MTEWLTDDLTTLGKLVNYGNGDSCNVIQKAGRILIDSIEINVMEENYLQTSTSMSRVYDYILINLSNCGCAIIQKF